MKVTSPRRDTFLIFITLLLAYAYVLPRWADWSQTSRLNLVRAMAERGTVQIDAYVSNTGDYAIFGGHAYSDKAPGPAFAGLPFYMAALPIIDHPAISERLTNVAGAGALSTTLNPQGTGLRSDKVREFIGQYLLTILVIAIPSAAGAAVLYHLLATFGYSRGLRLLVTFGYGLATPAATYAGNFYSHQVVAVICLSAFALLVWLRHGAGGNARAFLAGLLLGYAVISEYPAALIVGILGLYALLLLPRRLVSWIIAGGLIPLILLASYDMVAFGTPLPVGYNHSALWQDQHKTGFVSITYPHAEALWGLLFGSFRGLFVRAPWLALALAGWVIWWRRGAFRTELLVTLGAAGSTILFYASSVMWWGGFSAGPRYIVPAIPFLALGAAPALWWLWSLGRADPALRTAAGNPAPETNPAGAPLQALGFRLLCIALVIVSAVITWAEAVAGQLFPTDATRATWTDYVLPAWQQGNIARNVGTVLGLPGSLSLLPLAAAVAILVAITALSRPRPALAEDDLAPGAAAGQRSSATG